MLVKYFIPADGDEQEHPNVFSLDANQPLTVSSLQKSFPLPGKYHFRFLSTIGKHTVWLDITDSATIPMHQSGIFMKVDRIATGDSDLRQKNPVANHSNKTIEVTEPPKNEGKSAVQPVAPLIDGFDDGPYETKKAVQQRALVDDDLLGIHADSSFPQAATKNYSNPDLFGLESLQPTNAMRDQSPIKSPMLSAASVQPPQQVFQPMQNNRSTFGMAPSSNMTTGFGRGPVSNQSSTQRGGVKASSDPFASLTGLSSNSSTNPMQSNYNNQRR